MAQAKARNALVLDPQECAEVATDLLVESFHGEGLFSGEGLGLMVDAPLEGDERETVAKLLVATRAASVALARLLRRDELAAVDGCVKGTLAALDAAAADAGCGQARAF